MKLRHGLALVLLALCCSYSYSDNVLNVAGSTTNAATGGNSWNMVNVLPQVPGLQVNGIIYQYTTQKNISDPFTVSVQNQNALASGYIFRSTDDWSGLPGNTIRKSVPVDNIPIQYWGDGEISTTGRGLVLNPSVVYMYKYDECNVNPLVSALCPGYFDAMRKLYDSVKTTDYDPLSDENVKKAVENKTAIDDDQTVKNMLDKRSKTDNTNEKKKPNLDIALKAANNALLDANAIAKSAELDALNNIANFELYKVAMPGGMYKETINLRDAKLPDNRRALRNNMAQQILHEKMVDSQYK